MATQQGPITKIYELKVVGFDEAKVEFDKMSVELAKLKKQKQELDKEFAKATNPAQISDLNKKIQAQVTLEADLTKKITEKNKQIQISQTLKDNAGGEGVGAAIVAYQNLIKQYKEAKIQAELMEAQFGKESDQAKEAAKAAVLYENELIKINNLKKGIKVGKVPDEEVPFTHNLNADGTVIQPELTSAKTALNEYDKAQAEVANSATALGEGQRKMAGDVKAAGPVFAAVKGSLDQYTGTLRDNIKAQLENASSIAANKAAQKEIQEAIKLSGAASTGQIEKLAALKEEAIILDQTNKELTVTIRNQAKEFISSAGSLAEGRAQVNQLQQAYAQLSESERATPFGQSIKNEIDVLEPKVKELEGTIGLFQRNVGNYPSTFTGAFTVLEKELDTLQGKLVKGNFSGKEFDDLSKKTATLNEVTKTLNTTFKTTTQEQGAYKEAARQVGVTFGTDSEVFKSFSKEVGVGNSKLKETDTALNAVAGTGNKAGKVFQSIFSGLRNIANIVPGLGLSGLILLLITPLSALASKIFEYTTKATGAQKVTEDLKKNMEEMNVAVHESQNEFVSAVTSVETLRNNIALAKDGFLNKDKVLKEYNDTLGKTTGEVKTLDQAELALVKNGDAYVKMMLYKAAANVALQNAAKKSFEAEEARRKSDADFVSTGTKILFPTTSTAPGFVPGIEAQAKVAENARLARAKTAKDTLIKEADDASKTQLDIAKKFQTDAAKIAKDFSFDFFVGKETEKKTKEHADRLNIEEQNAIKLIDATLKNELAVENTRVTEIEKVHQLTFDEEIVHSKRIEEININALNSKIALLSKQKNLNAEELATLAEFKEKRSEIELQTSQKIQEIEKKRFADQDKDLKASIDKSISDAKEAQRAILDNPDTSNIERARANLHLIDSEIEEYKKYYQQLLKLNDNYNSEALQKARLHIKDLQRERNTGSRDEVAAIEKDIQAEGDAEIVQVDIEYQKKRTAILTNERITSTERQRLLETLSRANNVTILTKELETLKVQLSHKALEYAKSLISEEEYEKARLAIVKKAGDLEAALREAQQKRVEEILKRKPKNVEDLVSKGAQKGAIDLFNIDEKDQEDAAAVVGEAINQSFSLATDAMHNYYDAERQRIQDSLEMNMQRLDLEEQQVKARATSQAEIDSIDKQYAAKKKAAQQAAGEETKKSKKAELRIALATEIGNIAVASNAYPFPFSLGIFALLSGLALGRYALGVSQINAQKFAYGGEVPTRGGKFGGKQHSQGGTPFRYKGEEFEAEVDELSIIRTKNVNRNKIYQLTGTHTEIASKLNVLGGGVEFKRGAKVKMFAGGGALGNSLQAPVFVPSTNSTIYNSNSGMTEQQLNAIVSRIDKMNEETSKRFERIEVVQVTSTVSKAQQKQVQQKMIGTL